ncbi:MAG: FtsX-like permease family protein [Thermoproteota archaeon]
MKHACATHTAAAFLLLLLFNQLMSQITLNMSTDVLVFADKDSSHALNNVKEMADSGTIESLVNFIDYRNIEEHVRVLSSYSRFTGYPGCTKAAKYIAEQLESYGLKPFLQNYTIVVPFDEGATLTTIEENPLKINIFPMLPNLACPPATPALEGRLIYGGKGSLKDLMGLPLNDSVVMLEFNSGYSWLNAAQFGAKAFLFIEPTSTTSYEADSKRINIPVNIPRFYVLRKDAERLLQRLNDGDSEELRVHIRSQIRWETREAQNVVTLIKGQINETIAIFSFYDAFSVVPSIAHDADAAAGVATWLEIARYFSLNKPLRNVMLVSFSGHFQTLAGGIAFVDEYIFGEKLNSELGYYSYGKTIKIALGLDISTDSPSACLAWGTSQGNSLIKIGRVGYAYIREIIKPVFYESAPSLQLSRDEQLTKELQQPIYEGSLVYYLNTILANKNGYKYMIGDRITQIGDSQPLYPLAVTPYMRLESQLIVQAGGIGLTIHTSRANRLHWGLPIGSLNNFNLKNLRPQAEFSLCLAYLYVWLAPEIFNRYVNMPGWTKWDGTGLGWPRFEGKVLTFNTSLGKYVEVPDALIMFHSLRSPDFEIVLKSNKEGSYRAIGFQTAVFGTATENIPYHALAFVVNETTGNVEYAPDSGVFGAAYSQSFIYWLRGVSKEVEELSIPLFKCGLIALHGLIDPSLMSIKTSFKVRVNDVFSHAELMSFSESGVFNDCYSLGTQAKISNGIPVSEISSIILPIFVPPDTHSEILLYIGPTLVGILNNGSNGLTVKSGQTIHVFAPLKIASDVLLLNDKRLNTLHTYGIYSGMNMSEIRQLQASQYLKMATIALLNRDYERCVHYSYKSWNYVIESYLEVKNMFIDTINSIAFISLLTLLFSILLERLVFSSTGLKRAFVIISIFAFITILCSRLHPGYYLASNMGLVLLALSSIFMLLPAIMLLFSMASHQLFLIKEEYRGIEAPPIDKLSAFLLSLFYGVANMRKRKFRSTLTLSSVIAIAFAITLLTGINSYSWANVIPENLEHGYVPYEGYMLRTTEWSFATQVPQGLSNTLLRYLEYQFPRSIIAPRVLSPIMLNPPYYSLILLDGLPRDIAKAPIRGVMGLSVMEPKLIKDWNNSIIAGRWFGNDEGFECLVSSDIAMNAEIRIGQNISWADKDFLVVGIFDPAKVGRDIDGEPITPRDFGEISRTTTRVLPRVPHLENGFIIVPWKTLLRMGGEIMSIAVKTDDVSTETAISLAFETGAHVYAVTILEGRAVVLKYSKTNVIITSGFDYLLIPLIIGALIIANTMLGSVYERRKDIFTFSVVGLSLTQIFSMFLAEAIVYGGIGTFLGYLLAMIVANVSKNFQIIILFNFTSGYVILALSTVILTMLAAMSLPFLSVAQIATPSLERKWKVSRPKGDYWDIRFPLLIGEDEFSAFLVFVKEYLENQSGDVLSLYNLKSTEISNVRLQDGSQELALHAIMDLLPPELGVSQEILVAGTWDPQRSRYSLHVVTKRLSGTHDDWVRRNTVILNILRKRFLLWKGLTTDEKSRFKR